MKTVYKQDLKETYLQVEVPVFYQEDYQIAMLQANKLTGILPMTSKGIDGLSYYSYDVSGMESMKTRFEKTKMEKQDMENFVVRLIDVIQNLKNYMLDGDRLLLAPEHIFCRKDKFYFCYLPVAVTRPGETFHELTEYFVSQVNYEENNAIRLAYELHKTSMEEHYDIEQILEEYHKKELEEREKLPAEDQGNIFELEEEDEDFAETYRDYDDIQSVQEMNGALGWIKRNLRHKKREKWGVWEGLVTEDEFVDL